MVRLLFRGIRAKRTGWSLCLILCGFAFLSCGCSYNVEKATIEDMAMIGVIGVDYVDAKTIKLIVTYPQLSDSANAKQTVVLTEKAANIEQGIVKMAGLSERILSSAQLRVVLFGERFARETGLMTQVKHLYRDSAIGDGVLLAVARGSAEEIMSGSYSDKPEFDSYLYSLLHPSNISTFNPYTTIHSFVEAVTDEVSDPTVPIIRKEGNNIRLMSVGLLRGDKLLGELSPDEAYVSGTLQQKRTIPTLNLLIAEETGKEEVPIILRVIEIGKKVYVSGSKDAPRFDTRITLRVAIKDYNGKCDLDKPGDREQLGREINQALEGQTMKVLSKLQRLRIDPLAFGERIRARTRGPWNKKTWEETMTQTRFDVKFDCRIVNSGILK